MAQDPENSQKQLLSKLLECEFGISATVGVGTQLMSAYETYKDINLDIERFFERKQEFETVQVVLKDIKPIKQQLETLGKNADPGTLKKIYNQLCEKCGKEIQSYDEATKQLKSLDAEYSKLEKIFGDAKAMTSEADKILEQRRVLTVFQLVVSYGRLMTSCYHLKQNSKELTNVENELNDIKIKYLQPILKQLELNDYSNNNNNDIIDDKKIMRRIGFVKGRLEAITLTIKKQSESAKSERWLSGVEAILSGLNFVGSVSQIRSLTGVASNWQIGIQTGIAALQGAAAVGHAAVAVWAHWNVLEWERVEADVEKILLRVDELEKQLLN